MMRLISAAAPRLAERLCRRIHKRGDHAASCRVARNADTAGPVPIPDCACSRRTFRTSCLGRCAPGVAGPAKNCQRVGSAYLCLFCILSAAKGRLCSHLAIRLDRTRHLDHRLLSGSERWIERNVEKPPGAAGDDARGCRSCDPVLYRRVLLAASPEALYRKDQAAVPRIVRLPA